MGYKETIAGMKCPTLSQASQKAINVCNLKRELIGKLVPVGSWILDDSDKIELICAWRQRAMRMFLAQFESTFEKTYAYLSKLSIDQEGRLFFLLYDQSDRLVGHMGISGVDGCSGELDNLMRGVDGGDPRLIYFSEIALLDWCFKNLEIEQSDALVLSYNWVVRALHEEVGYAIFNKSSLRKYEKDSATFHEEVDPEKSNVTYSKIKLLLTRSWFYEKNSWIE